MQCFVKSALPAAAFVSLLGLTLPGGDALADNVTVGAGSATGCLTPGGAISQVAPGDAPARPCPPSQSQISLGGGREVPFYIVLDGDGDEETIATNGPLEYFARCRVNSEISPGVFRDIVEIVATSTEDGWFLNHDSGPNSADDELVNFVITISTGDEFYDNDIDNGTMAAPDGSYLAIDGEMLGLGLNIFGHDCIVIGTAVLINGTP
jgi:hypothetical protein